MSSEPRMLRLLPSVSLNDLTSRVTTVKPLSLRKLMKSIFPSDC